MFFFLYPGDFRIHLVQKFLWKGVIAGVEFRGSHLIKSATLMPHSKFLPFEIDNELDPAVLISVISPCTINQERIHATVTVVILERKIALPEPNGILLCVVLYDMIVQFPDFRQIIPVQFQIDGLDGAAKSVSFPLCEPY